MRVALVINPKSGSAPDPDAVVAALEGDGAQVVERADSPGELDGSGAERLVGVSGDGMVAALAERAGELDIPLAVVPGGTANDFARAMGLPETTDAALELAATGTKLRRMELAFLGDRPFVNVVGAGLAPEAGRHAAPHKDRLGPLAYPAGALLAGLRSQPLGTRVLVDGRELFSGRTWQVTVASAGAFGGGAQIDEADPHDGELDVLVLPAGPRFELPKFALGMRRGTLAEQKNVRHDAGARVELLVAPETPLNVDGELVAAAGLNVLTVRPDAYALVTG